MMPVPRVSRNRWIAFFAGLSLPGMGQVYNGDLVKGFSFFSIFAIAPVVCLRAAMLLPDSFLVVGVGGALLFALAIYFGAAVEALRFAGRFGEEYELKPFNRWYVYLALWMVATFLVGSQVFGHTRDEVVQLIRIAGGSMEPVAQKGDFVIVDKTAYSHVSPLKNDVVIHIYPDDRSKLYIKRIIGLPGETIRLEDGRDLPVPHGSVFVMGDNRDNSLDSRTFGPVPLVDVLGKARQIYFSLGETGICWSRIGKPLGSD